MNDIHSLDNIVEYLLDIIGPAPDSFSLSKGTETADSLLDIAGHFGITHYISSWLIETENNRLSESYIQRLEYYLIGNRTRNTVIMSQIEELNLLFRSVNIPVIFLKGTAGFLRGVYSLSRHYMTDIDILVPEEFVDKTIDCMKHAGYTFDSKTVVPEFHHHIDPLSSDRYLATVEIHLQPYFFSDKHELVTNIIRDNSDEVEYNGALYNVPSTTDHVWIAIRSAGTGFGIITRLRETIEVFSFLEKGYNIDFVELAARAENENMSYLIEGLLYSCRKFFNIEVPYELDEKHLEKWFWWSRIMQRQTYKNISFPASRKRYGMIKFLAGSGFKEKYRFFMKACRYEVKIENKLSGIFTYFKWVLLPWRVVKNLILYAVWLPVYSLKTSDMSKTDTVQMASDNL